MSQNQTSFPVNLPDNPDFLPTVIKLSRMYGVAECLNDISYLDMATFMSEVTSWATEYLNKPDTSLDADSNLIDFFHCKMEKLKKTGQLTNQ